MQIQGDVVLLQERREGITFRQKQEVVVFTMLAISQLPSAQNNPYDKVAYIEVAIPDTLQLLYFLNIFYSKTALTTFTFYSCWFLKETSTIS